MNHQLIFTNYDVKVKFHRISNHTSTCTNCNSLTKRVTVVHNAWPSII